MHFQLSFRHAKISQGLQKLCTAILDTIEKLYVLLVIQFFQIHFQGIDNTTGEVLSDVGRFDTKITFPLQNALSNHFGELAQQQRYIKSINFNNSKDSFLTSVANKSSTCTCRKSFTGWKQRGRGVRAVRSERDFKPDFKPCSDRLARLVSRQNLISLFLHACKKPISLPPASWDF